MEDVKIAGNKNGMPAEVFARSVVNKVMRRRTSMEIWQGRLAGPLRILTSYFPLWFLVNDSFFLFRKIGLTI